MYFKKLELLGFKSFAKKTVLEFEQGITAVVGPNGCGKSNIFDAIRWVLGEQSVKSLRGSQMGDVIFNGTETEAGLGFAEVSLVFDNSGKNLPIDYEEVVITRRLYRSGESEYLINKTQVRLKDILNLFLGTGIGAESYSFVGQGKIDLIVSIKPEERRYIIDEAAGIIKYKVRKNETLKKLQETENNLLRVNDIVIEVKRQITSIERQANKTRHYKEKFQKLKDLETQLAFHNLGDFDTDIENKTNQIKGLTKQEQYFKNEISDKTEKIQIIEKDLSILESELQESKDSLTEAKNNQKANQQNIKLNLERIDEHNRAIIDAENKRIDFENRIKSEEENISVLDVELSLLEAKVKQASDDLVNAESSINNNNFLIKSLQSDINIAKKEIFEKTTSLAKIKNELTDAFGQFMSWQARKRRLDIEVVKIGQEKDNVNEQFNQAQEEFVKSESDILNIKYVIEDIKCNISNQRADLENYKKIITDLESEMLTLESQKEFLQDLRLRYDNLPDAAKAVIIMDNDSLNNNLSGGIIGRVMQKSGPEVQDDINEKNTTRFNVEIKPIDLDARNITKRIEELKQEITDTKVKEKAILNQIVSEEETFAEKEKNLHQKEIDFSNINLKRTNLELQLVRFSDELNLIESERNEAEISLSELDKTINEFKVNIKNLEEGIFSLENKIDKNQSEITSCNDKREKEVINITKLKTELDALEDAKNNQIQTRKFLEQTKNSHFIDKESITLQEKESRQKLEQTAEANQRLESENMHLSELILILDKDLHGKTLELNDKKTQLGQLEQSCSEINKNLEQNNAKLFNIKLSVQEIQFKKKSILDRMQQLYQMREAEIKNMIQNNEPTIEIPNLEELQAEIEQLRKKLESYGNVNLVAVEEQEDAKQRLEFLTTQSNDLLEAKESLLKAIKKINQTSRKLFVETFAAVNEEFKKYFRTLFGGGQGNLFLVDEQDPLESGIEIICRPPGKKLQNVLLLSGGEKALAAIALMFAIFKVKPVPFCILDEIDGALDEANIDRFRKILEEFSQLSQYIVITHNKKTISSSDVMYGITMEQTGISKIVSVRFSKESPEQEPEMVASNS